MMHDMKLRQAIKEKHPIEFTYNGKRRVVYPYIYGKNQKKQFALSAYQIEGQASDPLPDWRQFIVDQITDIWVFHEQVFIPDAPEYNPNDKWFSEIIAKI